VNLDIQRQLRDLQDRLERLEKTDAGLPGIGARVYRTTNQSIPHNTNTALQFDAETYDTANFHDNVTNNTRLTIPYAGKYSISASIDFVQNTTGTRHVFFLINGTTFIAGNTGPATTLPNTTVALEAKYSFSAGDYVECLVYQNSGGALNVLRNVDYSPIFMIHRLP